MSASVIISRTEADAEASRFAQELARLAADAGACVLSVPDIYHSPDDSPLWRELATLSGRVVLVAPYYPRAAEWILRRHAPHVTELLALDSRQAPTPRACWDAIAEFLGPVGEGGLRVLEGPVAERWYPVVDSSRCSGCAQCVQFCIFGVWQLQDGRAVTARPDECKPGCPACARICARGAIIFPLCDQPDIAGAPTAHTSVPTAAPSPAPDRDLLAEIDALIDELDALDGEDSP